MQGRNEEGYLMDGKIIRGKESEKLKWLGIGIETGKGLFLNNYELKYCKEKGTLKSEIKLSKKEEKIYSLYKFLRERGYIPRLSEKREDIFRVYQKGFRPGEDRTKYLLLIKEEWPSEKEIEELLELGRNMRKETVIALVGNRITFLKISRTVFE